MPYLFQRKNYKDFNNPIYSLIGNVLALVFGHFPFAHFFLPRKLGVSTSKLPKQIIWVEQVFHALSFDYRVWGVLGSSRRVLFKATFLRNNDLSHPYYALSSAIFSCSLEKCFADSSEDNDKHHICVFPKNS